MTAIAEQNTFGLSGVRVGETYELCRGDSVPGYTEGSFPIGPQASERTLYQVTRGMVGVYSEEDPLASRNPIMASVIRPGKRRSGLFGFETLDEGAFWGNAVALTEVEVQRVIFSASEEHTAFLLGEAAREQRRQESFTSRLLLGDSKTRIAGALLDLAVVEDSQLVVLVTQREIGARSGIARDMVNKEIRALGARGIVFKGSKPLRVSDLKALRRRAQY